jgi:flagellar hook assembly protein FlgD
MQQQRQSSSSITPRRSTNREERSPGVMFTALSIGAVVILLAVTFLADWLRTPDLSITSAPPYLSPNQDNSYDTAVVSYRLSEAASVSARVLSEGGGIVRVLFEGESLTAGQHLLTWDGTDDLGRRVSDGSYRVEVTAKGSIRSSASSATVLVDTLPPDLQLLNLPEGTRVREDLLTLEGLTEANATVWLNGVFLPVPVDGQGRFRTQRKLSEGINTVEVRASDPAGNTTALTRTIDLVTAAPEVIITSPIEGAWLSNPLVTVTGTAPAGVTLKINNQNIPVTSDGAFRYDLLLDEGQQAIQISATDDVGNVTTVERFVNVKTRGPILELNVAEGAAFSDAMIQITGRTNPGVQVTVNRRPVTVGALGDFQTALELTEGDNIIDFTARDQAGNATNLTRRVRYQVPAQPAGWERLFENFQRLPALTLPVVMLFSILLGFFLYRQNRLAIELSVDSQNFTPGLPQEGKTLTLRLEINQAARVTLEVLDTDGQAQAVLLDNRRRTARQHVFLWNGYDDYGQPVKSGAYTIRAIAGAPPITVSSAVQVMIEEDPYVYSKAVQFEKIQPAAPSQVARRRLRQNRKRI